MSDPGRLSFVKAQDGTLVVRLLGVWSLRAGIPSAEDVQDQVASTAISRRVAFDSRELTSWDSSVVTFLVEVSELCRQRGIPVDREGLPVGVRKLLALTEAVPERRFPAALGSESAGCRWSQLARPGNRPDQVSRIS